MCSLYINGRAHGPDTGITTCQLHMRMFKDGETIVIAGLMNTQETKSLAKIPFLSQLPFFGGLFKSKSDSNEDHQVVIYITAHIVKDQLVSDESANLPPPTANSIP